MNATKAMQAASDLHAIRNYLPRAERAVIAQGLEGEEAEHFAGLIAHWKHVIESMPKTYEQDGKGMDAVVHLHYFYGGADWWITEKDAGCPDDTPEDRGKQLQAFGLADLFRDGGELGYISIEEVCSAGAELDLYWEPKTLAEVMKEKRA